MTNCNSCLELVDIDIFKCFVCCNDKTHSKSLMKNRYYFVDLYAAHIVNFIGESFKINTSYIGQLMSLKCGK